MSRRTRALRGEQLEDRILLTGPPVANDDFYSVGEGGELIASAVQHTTKGLQYHWKFDETDGTTAKDSAGSSDGTLVNWGSGEATWVDGQIGGALDFGDADNYVTAVKRGDFENYTFSFWSKLNERSGINPRIIEGVVVAFASNRGVGVVPTHDPTEPVIDTWEHYAVTVDTAKREIATYRNGTEVVRGVTGVYPTGLDSWILGHASVIGRHTDGWNGLIDDLRVYDRLLTTTEIGDLSRPLPGVLNNDTDPDDDTLTVELMKDVEHGELTLNADGTFRYTPVEDFSGRDSFQYRINDGTTNSGTATATINVAIVNDQPIATPQDVTLVEDTAVTITLSGEDGDAGVDQQLTFFVSTLPAQGSLSLTSGGEPLTAADLPQQLAADTIYFQPAENAVATQTFEFFIKDDGGTKQGGRDTSDPAIVTIKITPVNDLPVAHDDRFRVVEDGNLITTAVRHTTDRLQHHWTFDETDGTTATDSAGTSDGTLVNWGTEEATWVNGNVGGALDFGDQDNYVTAAKLRDFEHYTFTAWLNLTKREGINPRIIESVIVRFDSNLGVGVEDVYDPNEPVVDVWEHYAVTFDTTNRLVAVYRDGVRVSRGTAQRVHTGLETWIIGHASVVGRHTDGWNGLIDDLRVYDRLLTAPEIAELSLPLAGVLSNDTDPDDDTLTVELIKDVEHGELTLNADGTFRYTPVEDFSGRDSFQYRINDGTTNSGTATATINVAIVNDQPIATPQDVTLVEDTAVTITLSGEDGDAGVDQQLTFFVSTLPAQGSLSLTSGGEPLTAADLPQQLAADTIYFQPAENAVATQTFEFFVKDDGGTKQGGRDTSDPAPIQLEIAPVNDQPTADSQDTNTLGGELRIDLTGDDGDSDVDQALTFVISTLPDEGTLSLTSSGSPLTGGDLPHPLAGNSIYFTPTGSSVEQSFQFHVADDGGIANGGQDTGDPATVSISIAHEQLTLSIVEDTISELSGTTMAMVTRTATEGELVVMLSTSDSSEATVQTSITIPNGVASSAPFSIDAVDDALVDGDQTVIFTVQADLYPQAMGNLIVSDFEPLTVLIAAESISENGGSTTARVTRTDTRGPLTINLSTDDSSEASVDASIEILDGEATSAPFAITAVNDALLDGTRSVIVQAAAIGYQSGTDSLDVTDFEVLTLAIVADSISEKNERTTITVTRTDPNGALSVTFSSSDTTEARINSSVSIPDGDLTSPPVTIFASDDADLDGSQTVTITASASDYQTAEQSITVVDHEALTLAIDADELTETQRTTGTVTRANTDNSQAVFVTLSDTTGRLAYPASLTIPANETSIDFEVKATYDIEDQGTELITITSRAAGFIDGTDDVTVAQNPHPWHNLLSALNVDNDGSNSVTPIDALIPINRINAEGTGPLSAPIAEPTFFPDVNGDNFLSPLDPLIVINFLNGVSGEGEATDSTLHSESLAVLAQGGFESLFRMQHSVVNLTNRDDRNHALPLPAIETNTDSWYVGLPAPNDAPSALRPGQVINCIDSPNEDLWRPDGYFANLDENLLWRWLEDERCDDS